MRSARHYKSSNWFFKMIGPLWWSSDLCPRWIKYWLCCFNFTALSFQVLHLHCWSFSGVDCRMKRVVRTSSSMYHNNSWNKKLYMCLFCIPLVCLKCVSQTSILVAVCEAWESVLGGITVGIANIINHRLVCRSEDECSRIWKYLCDRCARSSCLCGTTGCSN